MSDFANRPEQVNQDPRLDRAEREMYVLLGFMAIAWVVVSIIAARLLAEPFASAVSVFVPVFGSWFVSSGRRARISLAKWAAFSLAATLVASLVRRGMQSLV